MKVILKWVGLVLGSLIGLLAVAFVVLVLIGGVQANRKYDIPVKTVPISTDAAAIRRGEHMANTHLRARCHTGNLGGELSFTIPGLLSIPSPNLTSGTGGVGRFDTDMEFAHLVGYLQVLSPS